MKRLLLVLALMPLLASAQVINGGGVTISGVASFNTRSGAVVPASGDYNYGQIGSTGKASLAASTTGAASMNVAPGTAPTSPANGDMWVDSTQKTLQTILNGNNGAPTRALFTQTSSVTVANTVTETTLLGMLVPTGGATLPASYCVAGKTMILEAFGYHSATGNPSIRIRVYKGTTVLADTGNVSSATSTNDLIQIRVTMTCRSSTSIQSQGFYQESGGGAGAFEMVNTSPTMISSSSEALNVTVQWGTASSNDTITLTNLSVRELN